MVEFEHPDDGPVIDQGVPGTSSLTARARLRLGTLIFFDAGAGRRARVMPLSKKKRFEVFKRDKFTCCYCGRRPPEVTLQVDHVLPRCEGGGDEMENLTTSCSDCNLGKGGRLLDDVAPVLDELEVLAAIQETCERRMALQASLAATQEAENTENLAIDSVVDWWNEYCPCSMLERDIPSVRHFVRSLEMDRIRESILLAARIRGNHNSRFKYFCACCWNMIRGEAESA